MIQVKAAALLASLLAIASGIQLAAQHYHIMPRLYHLDDYDICTETGGTYCLGSFLLRPRTKTAEPLFEFMLKQSKGRHSFNHTLINRGYCVSSRCSHIHSSPHRQFERCVSERTQHQHGLEAKLIKLEYCEKKKDKQFDAVDWSFTAIVAVLVVWNVVGTAYDLLKSGKNKVSANPYLMSWSVRANLSRLFATYDDGDPRLTALKSVQGIKAFTMALVLLAHSMLVHHMSPIQNVETVERQSSHWLSSLLQNGSAVVQGFFVISSFLSAYNILLLADNYRQNLSIKMLPLCVLHRLIRILPLYIFVLGLTTTWWPASSSGALWTPFIRGQAAICRRTWWTHLLFINNLYNADDKCLIQTWFLAADFQLYIVGAALTLLLSRHRQAVKVLVGLFLGSIAFNITIAYHFGLKPMILVNDKEVIHSQYTGNPSYKWLYVAPWGSLPAALLGVLLAFLQRDIHTTGYRPESNKIFRIVYPFFLPALVLWVLGGHWMHSASPLGVATYAALDKVGYIIIGTVGLIGFFNGVESIWKRFFEWRGWLPLGRMSLAVMLVHWNHHLTHMALRTQPSRVAVYEIGGHWHSVHFMSYTTAIPLHLMVELPAQRFLTALLLKYFGDPRKET